MTDAEKITKLLELIKSVATTMVVVHAHLPEGSRDAVMLESSYKKIERAVKEVEGTEAVERHGDHNE